MTHSIKVNCWSSSLINSTAWVCLVCEFDCNTQRIITCEKLNENILIIGSYISGQLQLMIRLLLRWLNSATATVVAVITRIVAVAVLIIPNLHHRRMDKILAIAKRCAVLYGHNGDARWRSVVRLLFMQSSNSLFGSNSG